MRNINRTIDNYTKELDELYDELNRVLFLIANNINGEKNKKRLDGLYGKIEAKKREILLMSKPTYTNEILDLYLDKGNSCDRVETYNITFHGEFVVIGRIRVTLGEENSFLGNIGYELKREYRGHGYMLNALEILRKPLIEKGLEKPIITVVPDNIPSVKTIQKFGGKLVEVDDQDCWYDTYEVDLLENDDENVKSM